MNRFFPLLPIVLLILAVSPPAAAGAAAVPAPKGKVVAASRQQVLHRNRFAVTLPRRSPTAKAVVLRPMLRIAGRRPQALGPARTLRLGGKSRRVVLRAAPTRLAHVLPSCGQVSVVASMRMIAVRRATPRTRTLVVARLSLGDCVPKPSEGSWTPATTPAVDSLQLWNVPFGTRSHWLQPWKAYMETPPATALRAGMGINFNVSPDVADATAQVLADSGIRRARVEISWGNFQYDNPDQLVAQQANGYRTILEALRDHGIRPLILLNANAAAPCPRQLFKANLTAPAHKGDRTIVVDQATAAQILPGRTGIDQNGKAAGILFKSVAADRTVELAAPLPYDLPAGLNAASTLRYAPFTDPALSDWTPNPAYDETLNGWFTYVGGVTDFVKSILHTTDFDLEIWNELSSASSFLYAGTYYDPAPAGQGNISTDLPSRTVAWLRDPARGLRNVGITNGFASQRPWDASSLSPSGLTALSKHPYHNMTRFPANALVNTIRPVNALGKPDFNAQKQPAGDPFAQDGFTPTYDSFFPEYFLTGTQTETLVRDLSPFATEFMRVKHGRNAQPAGASPVGVWLTEMGMDPNGADPQRPDGTRVATLSPDDILHLQAKAALRTYTSYMNKGAGAVYLFAATWSKLALIPDSFYAAVRAAHGAVPPDATPGPVMAALSNMNRVLAAAKPIRQARPLTLDKVFDVYGGKQFEGDGTLEHPALYNRDVLAFLPFQLDDSTWAVPTYVMTRNIAKLYRPAAPAEDVTRYDLPGEPFRLVVSGVDGRRMTASLSDPLSGESVPVAISARTPQSVTVDLAETDSPRMLLLHEGAAGR